MSKDFSELESEFLHQDAYADEMKQKMDRRMLVSNFLESKEQSKQSKFGGEMMAETKTLKSNYFFKNDLINNLALNFTYFAAPLFCTAMIGTITYPIAVRISKKVFKFRNFYSIHFSIAPFLSLIHINFFALI